MRLAVITGGSRGLGAALFTLYSAAGWQVVEFSRTAATDRSVHVDLSLPHEAAAIFATTFAPLSRMPFAEIVAFSNAATVTPVGPVDRLDLEAISEHISVNITSGAADRGIAGWSSYCASKAAMANHMRALASEQSGRRHPIHVMSIDPGVMDTDMQATVRSLSPEVFPEVERYVRLKKEDRLAPPAQVAAQIARIVSSRSESGDRYHV